jgi:hypothetical protein
VRDGDRLPARSRQRSSYESPQTRPADPVWTLAPSQALLDQLAEADLAHRLVETRKVEADVGLVEDKRAHRRAKTREVEARTAETKARARLLAREEEKVAGEVAQQPLEEREREVRIEREEVSILKALTWTLLPVAFIAAGLITGSIDARHLVGHGSDFIGDKSWLLPNLIGR